jgi:5-methylcytosine-specific restriction endonuclease McrA
MKRTLEGQRTYERNKQLMYRRDGWKCRHCGSRSMLTPHHLIFQGHGGTDDLENLLCLCMKCHDDVHDRRLLIEIVDTVIKFWRHDK